VDTAFSVGFTAAPRLRFPKSEIAIGHTQALGTEEMRNVVTEIGRLEGRRLMPWHPCVMLSVVFWVRVLEETLANASTFIFWL
jgi:hypothetical protein